MDEGAIAQAYERLEQAIEGRVPPAELEATIERAQAQLETLAAAAAELETTLPARVADAVREGVRTEGLPLARGLAEVRGLSAQTVGRLERLRRDLLAERHSRVDDLALLVELIASGWRGVDARLARIERALGLREQAEPSAGRGRGGAAKHARDETADRSGDGAQTLRSARLATPLPPRGLR